MAWCRRVFSTGKEDATHEEDAPAPDPTEQAVPISIPAENLPADFGLDLIEDPLAEELATSGLGEYDGHDRGHDGSVIYTYGQNAAAMPSLLHVMAEDGRLDFPPGTTAEVRLGPPGAESRIVTLG